MNMKKKSGTIKNFYESSYKNKKRNYFFVLLLTLFLFAPVIILSGCAKTGYPLPPKISPPKPPVILSAGKFGRFVRIVYRYNGNIDKIKGFLIYKKYYKNKKSIKYSCNSSKPFVFQNLKFNKKFILQNNDFFYNVNKINLKNGYYLFCAKSVGNYDIKSNFSNYIITLIILIK